MKALKAPSKCGLIKNLVKHEVHETFYKAKKLLGSSRGGYISVKDWEIPKSDRVSNILKLAKDLNHPALFNHGLRSYSFGKIMMSIAGERVDEEVFFAGSLLHDLGLMRNCTGTTFEVVGADEACGHCKDTFNKKELEILHEMILLHDAVGQAENKSKELKYLHYGAGIDVADLWSHRIDVKNYNEVFQKYPSLDHINIMIQLMKKRLSENPNMHLSTLMSLGFTQKMRRHKSFKL